MTGAPKNGGGAAPFRVGGPGGPRPPGPPSAQVRSYGARRPRHPGPDCLKNAGPPPGGRGPGPPPF
jgi:hypothetical protein